MNVECFLVVPTIEAFEVVALEDFEPFPLPPRVTELFAVGRFVHGFARR